MKKFSAFLMGVVFLALLATTNVWAAEVEKPIRDRMLMAWVEGGASIGGKPQAGVGLGFRLGYIGFGFGYGGSMDYRGSEVLDAAPVNPAVLMEMTSLPLGKKTIDPAFGGDIYLFYDLTDSLAIYGGPGMYFQEERNVYEILTIKNPASYAWQAGGHYSTEYGKYALKLAGGGGIVFKAKDFNKKSIILTLGYHSIRGISGGVGLAF